MNKVNILTLSISFITSRRDKINKIAALKPLSVQKSLPPFCPLCKEIPR